ncbi:MAG: hypothetical protein ACTHZ5_14635 [Micrococcaceae bacterium]
MSQKSDDLAAQIAKLKRKQREQTKKEYEAFGHEVADLLAPNVTGTTARIEAALATLLNSDAAARESDDPVARESDDSVAHENADSVAHGYGDSVAHAGQDHGGGDRL